MQSDEKRNLFIAIVITGAILFGWSYFYDRPKHEERMAQQQLLEETQKQNPSDAIQSQASNELRSSIAPQPIQRQATRSEALASNKRIKVQTPSLSGSIRLKGARIDDLTLEKYSETTEENSDKIHLLSPQASKDPYFAEFGWVSDKHVNLPNADTVWASSGDILTPKQPVTLSWNNGQGLVFNRTINVDEDYLFTITDSITNESGESLNVYHYGLISRQDTPVTGGFFILHEGPLGVLNQKLVEVDYKDLQEKSPQTQSTQGGWIGITDKYWLTAIIPAQDQQFKASFRDTPIGATDRYQADFMSNAMALNAGQNVSVTNHFFAGAKILNLLDAYEEKLGVGNFDRAVDFGWFYIITKPIFHLLTSTYEWLGNFGLAIMLLTVILKILFFPLANKSYRSMGRMKQLQPKIERLKTLYGDDKMRMNQEMMELYKTEKVNPMAGCLPMLIQIPVFFALYKVLFVSIEMRHTPFYGWVQDLSAPDPTSLFNLFGMIPWDPPGFLMIGIWPLVMGITMFLQQKLNPPPADPAQAKVFMLMPIMFTFMLAQFPVGLVIYWTWNNILTIIQQWTIMRMEEKRTAKS